MKSQASTLPVSHPARPRTWSVGFGPYMLVETIPWLLLATAIRGYARQMESGLALLVLVVVQFALFMAFLVACHRTIQLAGGTTDLGRLSFNEQCALARGVLGRMFGLFFAVVSIALFIGVDKFHAAVFWLGFDGIVYNWPSNTLLIWSAVVATIAFLMVIEKGAGREPKFPSVWRHFMDRWRYLFAAIIAIIGFQIASNFVQAYAAGIVQPLYDRPIHYIVKNMMYLAFFFSLSYVRLWATVTILTYALRASYRKSGVDSNEQ
jgi:hypothetical protein